MATFDLTAPEQWYPVPSLPGYEISSHYRVGSYWTNQGITKPARRILLTQYTPAARGNRPYVNARVPWKTDNRRPIQIVQIGWMVADVVYGPKPSGLNVLHKDDDPTNNHPSNLYYGTKQNNMEDAIRNGRWKPRKGEERHNARLTDEDINAIRRLDARGVPQWIVAALFDVHQSHVSKIISGEKWGHLLHPADSSTPS